MSKVHNYILTVTSRKKFFIQELREFTQYGLGVLIYLIRFTSEQLGYITIYNYNIHL